MSDNARFVAIVAVVLVIVGGFVWFVFGGGSTPTEVGPESAAGADRAVEEAPPAAMAPAEVDEPEVAATEEPGPGLRLVSREVPESTRKRPTGAGSIRGEVKWRSDEGPAAGAEITVEIQDWQSISEVPKDKLTWTTTTDGEGKFTVTRIPVLELTSSKSMHYSVTATMGGAFGMTSVGLTDDEPDGYAEIELDEVGAIGGRVVNAQGEGVADAFVFPDEGKDTRYIDGTTLRAVTDAEGRFEVANLPPGEWKLAVRADGYAVKISDFIATDTRDAEIQLSQGGGISGTVILAQTGEPVGGTGVVVTGEGGRWNRHAVNTEPDGTFQVSALVDSRYTIELDDPDRIIVGETPTVVVTDEQMVDDVTLTVAVGAVVTGRVYDVDTEEPVSGVRIRDMARVAGQSRQGVSDDQGFYRVTGMTEGSHTLRRRWKLGYLHGESREDKTVSLTLGQQVDGIDFPIRKGLFLRGIVVDTKGNPIERVSVTSEDTGNQSEGESTTTKPDGTFEHRGFSPNTPVMITARREGFAAAPVGPVTIGTEDLNDVKIVMEPGASIAGVVVDKTGKPQSNVYVNAQTQAQGYVSGDSTDRDGQFKLEGLSEGTYSMMLRRSTSGAYQRERPSGDPITVSKAQELTGVRLVLSDEEGMTISGRVVNSRREPVKDASVNAHSRSGNNSYGYTQTDEDGRYEIMGLQEGAHMVFVHHGDYSQQQLEEVAAGSRNIDFVLEDQATIEGRVLDARTGRPVSTFQLGHFNGITDRIHPHMLQNMTTFYDDNGVFQLTKVNAGDVSVIAKAEGYAPAVRSIPGVRAGETVSGIDLALEAGASVEGVVVDSRGVPLSGVQVFAGDVPNDQWMREQSQGTTTDGNGRFTLTSLSPDIASVGAYHAQYASTNVPVELAAGHSVYVEIRMGTGGTLEGVVRINGQPAANQHVSCHSVNGGQNRNVTTDANGYYEITGVGAGDYAVIAMIRNDSNGARTSNQTAAVESEMVTTVNFDFSQGDAAIEGVVTMDGKPLAEGHVSAMAQTGGGVEQVNTQIGGNGSYRLEGLPAGVVTLNVGARMGEQWQSRSVQVETLSGQTVQRDIEFDSGARVAGTVSGARQGDNVVLIALRGSVEIPSISQGLWTQFADRVAGQTQVASDGSYELMGIEPGDYTFVVVAFGNPASGGVRIEDAAFTTAHVSVGSDGATVDMRLPQ